MGKRAMQQRKELKQAALVQRQFAAALQVLQAIPLSADQLAELRAWLDGAGWPCIDLIEQAAGEVPACPRCGCPKAHLHGTANDLRRFRCTRCRRTYNALTGTPLARLRKRDKWLPYLQCLLDSITVRKAATRVGIAASTSFRWRHRFVSGVKQHRAEQLTGIVEADETYMLESQKGSRHMTRPPRRRGGRASRRGITDELDSLLVARDRSHQTLDFVIGRGEPGKKELAICLGPVLAADVLLVSDGAKAYAAFAHEAHLMHEALNIRGGERTRDTIHLQNVNSWHSRYKTWLKRFNGIASRYLHNYSGWQRTLDTAALTTPPLMLAVAVKARRTLSFVAVRTLR